ncbi:actin-like ATPase domain-containing protein [Ophiobolus disseminans]|uniref:Actin-like ATPase domain-containing protein n=1 Tax=Ophiobolus disseminans TaxID=1469910 RepID=A0A6A6ZQX4_9PLEO|nr:actin-like ATPase domain-containing protein [Ophiobolus disseminans]
MYKAPDLGLFNGAREPPERRVSRKSTPTSQAETATTSALPSPSSATSRTQSWVAEDTIQVAELPVQLPSPRSTSLRWSRPQSEAYEALESHRIVIAIDYGTTFTGVGFATPQSGADPTRRLKDIRIVTDWGTDMTNDIKIPSVISYSLRTSANELQFGANLSRNAVAMVNTKMELDVQETRLDELILIIQTLDGMKDLGFHHVKASKGLPEYTWKTPEDVVTDYLQKVFDPVWKATEYMGPIRDLAPVDVVITVPVDWSYKARNSTLKAVRKAGFNETKFPKLNKYLMVTEPEAAAVFTVRYMQEEGFTSLRTNQCFILCDAGGGTVDVVGFRIKQLTPNLELEYMTLATGAKCGSSFINVGFKKWLQRPDVLGDHYKMLDSRSAEDMINARATEAGAMRDLMRDFEGQKKAFHKECHEMHIDLPEPLVQLTVPGRVEEGELTITNEDMCSFFDPHVDRIIELIQDHVLQVEEKGSTVATILLIGGFSESEYLQQELQDSFENLRGIKLHRPATSWSAVVQGAVLYGMEITNRKHTKVMLPCPRNYGVQLNASFAKGVHDPRDQVTNPVTNHVMASKQLTWLIRKGDLLMAEEVRIIERSLVASFLETGDRVVRLPIYEYLGDDAPERYKTAHEEVEEVALLTVDFSTYPPERFERKVNAETLVVYCEAALICRLTVSGVDLVGELICHFPDDMNIFKNKKRLEYERIERQRIENQLLELQRDKAHQDGLQQGEIERQRIALECQQRAQDELTLRVEHAKQREDETIRRENERRHIENEKRRLEYNRQAADRQREQDRLNKMKEASQETLRDLRELIRERYELDVKIWSRRGARRPNRPLVETMMLKSDAIMEEILMMVEVWGDSPDGNWTKEEWNNVEIIRKKLREGGHRVWKDNPPWNDVAEK